MSELPINLTDLVVLTVVMISGFLAFFRGFIREALSIGAWVAAFFAGIYGFPILAPSLAGVVPDLTLVPWVAGLAIGVVTVIVLSFLAHYLAKAIQIEGLGPIDRSLGFLFGLARGAVLISLSFLMIEWALDDRNYPTWLNGAKSLPLVRSGADLLVRLMPVRLRPQLGAINDEARGVATNMILERLVSPPVKRGAPAPGSGYTSAERAVMNRAIKEIQ
ncbi:MAG: CvpA family protein [Alphaproteobacteria bacterium]|nr:CvpA family protein [Alphaproteobacteria bacterium]